MPKSAPKFAPKCLVLSWQVEKPHPLISPDISHQRFQISNQISPINFTPRFCRHGHHEKVNPKKRKFWAGYPCGCPVQNFCQAPQILKRQALWHGHAPRLSMATDESEKLRPDSSLPNTGVFRRTPLGPWALGAFRCKWHGRQKFMQHRLESANALGP